MLDLFEKAKKDELLEHVKFEIFGDEIANSEMIRGALEVGCIIGLLEGALSVSSRVHFTLHYISGYRLNGEWIDVLVI